MSQYKLVTYFHYLQSISPGAVKTEIFTEPQLNAFEENNFPLLNPSDISNAVLYVLGTPPHMQVNFQYPKTTCRNQHQEFCAANNDNFFIFKVHEMIIKPLGELF